jgi:hypothetical protein
MSLERLGDAAGWARDAETFSQCSGPLWTPAGSGVWRRGDCFADQVEIARIDGWPQIEAVARTKLEPFGKLRGEAGGRTNEEW